MGETPTFSCRAHVFTIDQTTKKSWLPASNSQVEVQFFYDPNREFYKILSIENTESAGKKIVINCNISDKMTFKKTSQKFGQWADTKASIVYGLGFGNEGELDKFSEYFNQVVEKSRRSDSQNSSRHGSITGSSSQQLNNSANGSVSAGSAVGISAGVGSAVGDTVSINDSTNAAPVDVLNTGTSSVAMQPPLSPSQHIPAQPAPPPMPVQTQPNEVVGMFDENSSFGTTIPAASPAPPPPPSGGGSGTGSVDPDYYVSGPGAVQPPPPGPPVSDALAIQNDSLRVENERLQLMLNNANANAKKWEVELNTLRRNNADLMKALQESAKNVEEWKKTVQAYSDECQRLRAAAANQQELHGMANQLEQMKIARDQEHHRLENAERERNAIGERYKMMEHEHRELLQLVSEAAARLSDVNSVHQRMQLLVGKRH